MFCIFLRQCVWILKCDAIDLEICFMWVLNDKSWSRNKSNSSKSHAVIYHSYFSEIRDLITKTRCPSPWVITQMLPVCLWHHTVWHTRMHAEAQQPVAVVTVERWKWGGRKNETENDSRSFFPLGKAYSTVSLLLCRKSSHCCHESLRQIQAWDHKWHFPRMQKELI